MTKLWAVLVILLVAAAGAFYFWEYDPQQRSLETAQQRLTDQDRELEALRGRVRELETARDDLQKQLADKDGLIAGQQTQVADLESIRGELQRSSSDLKQQVAAKEKELAALRATQDELLEGLKKEIADRQVQVERIRDQLRVEMVDEILFDSGEAVIKPAGLDVLRRVGAILKKVQNRRIEVQGHTDNVPIIGALAKRFPTNWELSAARATNVARFLQDEANIAPQLLTAAGFSEYRPRTSNDTEQGRRKNRRIEILLGPLMAPEKVPTAR